MNGQHYILYYDKVAYYIFRLLKHAVAIQFNTTIYPFKYLYLEEFTFTLHIIINIRLLEDTSNILNN